LTEQVGGVILSEMFQPQIKLELPAYENRNELLWSGIRNVPGCYGCYSDEFEWLYIGASKRLLDRIMQRYVDQHDGRGKGWKLGGCIEWYVDMPAAHLGCLLYVWRTEHYVRLERMLIRKYAPIFNKAFNPNYCK